MFEDISGQEKEIGRLHHAISGLTYAEIRVGKVNMVKKNK